MTTTQANSASFCGVDEELARSARPKRHGSHPCRFVAGDRV